MICSPPHVTGFWKCLCVQGRRSSVASSPGIWRHISLFILKKIKQPAIYICFVLLFPFFGYAQTTIGLTNALDPTAVCVGTTISLTGKSNDPNANYAIAIVSINGGLYNSTGTAVATTTNGANQEFTFSSLSFLQGSTTTTFQYKVRFGATSNDAQFGLAGSFETSNTITITVNPLPTASITGTLSVCKNSTQPNIRITGSGGTAPYTFTYTVNGGASQMTTTTGGSSFVDIPVPTSTVGSFVYSLVSVQESSASSCSNSASGSATITVNDLPTVVSVSPSTPAVCLGTLSFVETLTTTQNPDQYKIT